MVFHMYGLTEMSVWQTMTRMTSERMIIEMPILVKHQNLLSGKTISSLREDIKKKTVERVKTALLGARGSEKFLVSSCFDSDDVKLISKH